MCYTIVFLCIIISVCSNKHINAYLAILNFQIQRFSFLIFYNKISVEKNDSKLEI